VDVVNPIELVGQRREFVVVGREESLGADFYRKISELHLISTLDYRLLDSLIRLCGGVQTIVFPGEWRYRWVYTGILYPKTVFEGTKRILRAIPGSEV